MSEFRFEQHPVENEQELNEIEKESIKKYFQELFLSFDIEDVEFPDKFALNDQIKDEMKKIIQETDDRKKYREKFSEAVKIFFQDFLSLIQERKKEGKDVETLIQNLNENLFSISPSLFNYLDLEDSLSTVAYATRIPETQAYIGPSMIGELVYNLAFSSKEMVEYIQEIFQKAPLADQLDYLQVFQSVAVNAVANGNWAEPAVQKIFSVLTFIQETTPYPFVRFMSDVVLQRLTSEYEEPTQGVIQISGRREYGRNRSKSQTTQHENALLARTVKVDYPLSSQDVLQNVSKDFIGVGDGSGLVHQIGKFERKQTTEISFDPQRIQRVAENLRRENLPREWAVDALNIIFDDVSTNEEATQKIFHSLKKYSPQEIEEVRKVREQIRKLEDVITEKRDEFRRWPWEMQAQARIEFNDFYARLIAPHSDLIKKNKEIIDYFYDEGRFVVAENLEAYAQEKEATLPLVEVQPIEEVLPSQNVLLFQHLHHPKLREYIENRFGFSYGDISLKSQVQLLRFLSDKDEGLLEQVEKTIHESEDFKIDVLESFLSLSVDKKAGEAILKISEKVSLTKRRELFGEFQKLIHEGEYFLNEFQDQTDIGNPHDIFGNILIRAKDMLVQSWRRIENGEDAEGVVENILATLEQETHEQRVLSGEFRRLVEIFQEREEGEIDLRALLQRQERVYEQASSLYLKALHERGELKPIPEVHWRVDRSLEEQKRRFGFDVTEFLGEFADPKDQKILVEFGPGSGKSKVERREKLGSAYKDVGVADAVYYPLGECISKLINWEILEKELPEGLKLNSETKQLFTDALYKCIMIREGEEYKDNFSYNEEAIKKITQNPQEIFSYLERAAQRVEQIEAVPSTISTRDDEGNVRYPYKLSLKTTELTELKKVFAKDTKKYFREGSIFEFIPAHPEGMIIGDFDEIQKIKNTQVDVALAVRSTVYKRKEEWENYVVTMAQKLNAGGVLIDDSIRDNDGWYYRLQELKNAQEKIQHMRENGELQFDISLHVVLGPGFSGEDYSRGKVPLAFILGKETDALSIIQKHLEKGYAVVSLERVLQEKKYIAQLDKTGHTLAQLEGTTVGGEAGLEAA